MRLRIQFGLIDTKEVFWWQEVLDFPKLIKFCGRNFEWVFYGTDDTNAVDYVLTFSDLPSYHSEYHTDCVRWTDLFPEHVGGCECGSKYDRNGPTHMFYCLMWSKN